MDIKIRIYLCVFFFLFLLGSGTAINAQCYGTVHFDSKADTGGATGNTFTIITAHPNELILIGYNGWPDSSAGPVLVDGDTAHHVNTAHVSNSAVSEVYCYSAPLAGTHTIVCGEASYSSPYYLNFAASFYVTGTCIPLSCNSLISTETSIDHGDYDTDYITTTTPNEMIYCSAVYNTGVFPGNRLFMRGTTMLDTMHIGNGIDATVGDTVAAVPRTYTVNTSDINSCCGGEIVLVAIIPPLCGNVFTLSDSVVNADCKGNDGKAFVTASGGLSPYTYLWSPKGGTNAAATGLSAGTYTINVTDAGGCQNNAAVTITQPGAIHTTVSSIPADSACAGQHVILNASGANSYVWSTGATTSSITVIIPAGDTAYYGVKGILSPCTDSIPVKIKIIPKIGASISALHDTVCPQGTTIITAKGIGGGATYKWSTGATTSSISVIDTVTTTYTATVFGLCDSIQVKKTVTVIPLPKPIISGPVWRCKGMKDTLTVSSANNPTRYVWDNGKTTTSITTGAINADSTIIVTAYNSLGCPSTDTFHIAVKQYPGGNVNYPPGCGVITITAKPTGVGPFTYKWNTGETYDTINVFVTDTTTFSVIISNGCPITKTVTVIPEIPQLSACCSTIIFAGSDTTITASGQNIVKYLWTPPASLNCDTCATVIASPKVTTTYTVIGTDIGGCQTERTVTLVVDIPCFNFIVPNVFTPTNAGTLGLDNVFYINTQNMDAWSIQIFDRWGKEVFKSTNPAQYWDGNTESGSKALDGVYYYTISATCQGSSYKKDGFVQLIR